MKTLIKFFLGLLNTIYCIITNSNVSIKRTSFYFVKFNVCKTNNVIFRNSKINDTLFSLSGKNNLITVNSALISKTKIVINGTNNKLNIEPEVNLRSATIQIRGNNCMIRIGKGSTFGGIRIVNVGINNHIDIGENCLFADFIELWASDTHSIYDAEGNFINPERPVIIGNDVWIGSYVKILKGVIIGNGAVVGMNTTVTKNIAPKTLNVGNPLRCIKENISWSLKYRDD